MDVAANDGVGVAAVFPLNYKMESAPGSTAANVSVAELTNWSGSLMV